MKPATGSGGPALLCSASLPDDRPIFHQTHSPASTVTVSRTVRGTTPIIRSVISQPGGSTNPSLINMDALQTAGWPLLSGGLWFLSSHAYKDDLGREYLINNANSSRLLVLWFFFFELYAKTEIKVQLGLDPTCTVSDCTFTFHADYLQGQRSKK